jgi:predicted Fe-S protein YdhL (DUF1289 family)
MKKIIIGIIAVLALIQLIRPEKNNSNDYKNDISTVMEIPKEVKEIIKNSCADCHSNSTVYPWYSEIAPVSWYLASHVNDGKEHLNFSEWTAYNKDQKRHILKDLEEELEEHKMPLSSYLYIHKNAEMSKEQYETLLSWAKTIKAE